MKPQQILLATALAGATGNTARTTLSIEGEMPSLDGATAWLNSRR